jgi:hypothetical protein
MSLLSGSFSAPAVMSALYRILKALPVKGVSGRNIVLA